MQQDPVPQAPARPAAEAVIDTLPGPERLGQVAPAAAVGQGPEDAVDHGAVVLPLAAPLPVGGQEMLDLLVLLVGEPVGRGGDGHGGRSLPGGQFAVCPGNHRDLRFTRHDLAGWIMRITALDLEAGSLEPCDIEVPLQRLASSTEPLAEPCRWSHFERRARRFGRSRRATGRQPASRAPRRGGPGWVALA